MINFSAYRGEPAFDKETITIEDVRLEVRHFDTSTDSEVEAYFDYAVFKDVYRLVEPTIQPWNLLNAAEGDIWINEGFASFTSGTNTYEENPKGEMHLKATNSGSNAASRVRWTDLVPTPDAATKTTHYFKFNATTLGADTTSRFYQVFSIEIIPVERSYHAEIYTDNIKDANSANDKAVYYQHWD